MGWTAKSFPFPVRCLSKGSSEGSWLEQAEATLPGGCMALPSPSPPLVPPSQAKDPHVRACPAHSLWSPRRPQPLERRAHTELSWRPAHSYSSCRSHLCPLPGQYCSLGTVHSAGLSAPVPGLGRAARHTQVQRAPHQTHTYTAPCMGSWEAERAQQLCGVSWGLTWLECLRTVCWSWPADGPQMTQKANDNLSMPSSSGVPGADDSGAVWGSSLSPLRPSLWGPTANRSVAPYPSAGASPSEPPAEAGLAGPTGGSPF